MKIIRFAALVLMALIVFSGCRSSRRAAKETTTPVVIPQDTVPVVVTPKVTKEKRSSSVNALSAKMNLSLQAGKKSVNCTGTYRLKRDEVVQINLVYTVLVVPVNVGSLELTPDYVLVVDRINKRYCKAAYDQIPEFKKAGVNFQLLQRVFWGDDEKVRNDFVTCVYSQWVNLSEGKFPGVIDFGLKGSSTKYKAVFKLSKIQETDKWDTHVSVPSKYSPVSLKTVMNAIMSVAK